MQRMGKMKFKFDGDKATLSEANPVQLLISHPNISGMQMDQITRNYTPAHYVDQVEVWQGDELIFRMEGGISLSEDPNFRFTYAPNGAKTLRVVAHDNMGGSFKAEWPIAEAS